jgi:hypothetical protein
VALLLSAGAGGDAPGPPSRRNLLDKQKEAVELLERAAAAATTRPRGDFAPLLEKAAECLEMLASSPGPEREELQRAAAELRGRAKAAPSGFAAEAYVRLLERLRTRLQRATPLGLDFQGSYSEPKVDEPAYGSHSSAMGPPPPPPAPAPEEGSSPARFEEVPGQLTVKTFAGGPSKDHLVESGGNGVALLDYDKDGHLDVYVVNAPELDGRRERIPHPNALYHNLGGWKFENVAGKAGVDAASWGYGVCAGDYDNDGFLDLYVTNFGLNFLFRNNRDGTFTDVAAAAGVQVGGWSTGCAFLDANGDGKLDLYVARYVTATWDEVVDAKRTLIWRGGPNVMVGPAGLPGAADVYLENRGDGTFVDATDARGLTDVGKGYGFGVVATDYDNDGWPDIFVANDSTPGFLYHNLGDGSFESVGLLAGVAVNADGRAQAGMGADAGDYDNDGWMDIVVATFAHDTKALYRNLGNGLFQDVSLASGLAAATFMPMGWGAVFLDADLDGRLDIYIGNGHLFPQVDEVPSLHETYRQKDQLFLNEGGRFRDVSASAGGGLQVQKASRGLAVGDLDNDGDPDLVVSAVDDVPTLLENRQRTGHHWLGVQLVRDGANRFAIGARVSVEACGSRQVREVRSGESYLSQSDLRSLFGLGSCDGPAAVEVRLGQERRRWEELAVDRHATLRF